MKYDPLLASFLIYGFVTGFLVGTVFLVAFDVWGYGFWLTLDRVQDLVTLFGVPIAIWLLWDIKYKEEIK